MKKITLLISVAIICTNTYSQKLIQRDTIYPKEQTETNQIIKKNKSEVQTLFQGQNSFGGYFAFSMGYTNLGTDDAFTAGGRLMFVANHYLGLGFGGKGIVTNTNEHTINLGGTQNHYHSNYVCGYGGLYIEPVILSLKPIHVAIPVLFGGGAMEYMLWDDDYNYLEYNNHNSVFMVFEPGVDIEFNIAKWFRIGLGASYRLTSNLENTDKYDSDLLHGVNYGITFKMGYF